MKLASYLPVFLLLAVCFGILACDDSGTAGVPDDNQGQFCIEDEDCDSGQICFESACLTVGDPGDSDTDIDISELDIPDSVNPVTQVCPTVSFSTSEVNFGAVVAGHSRTDILYIRNSSTNGEILNVYEVYYDPSQTSEYSWSWYFEDDPETAEDESTQEITLPYALEPGESMAVTIHYQPTDGYADTAWLHVATDDCVTPISKIELISEFKGTREICVEPSFLEWEGAVFGVENEPQILTVCNCGDPTGNKLLSVEKISFRDGLNTIFTEQPTVPVTTFSPALLSPRLNDHSNDHEACFDIEVKFYPAVPADGTNYMNTNIEFSDTLKIINDSETVIEQLKEVPLYGVARGGALISYPFPIDFGTKECGGEYNLPVTFINGTQHYLEITDILLSTDPDCNPFNLDMASVGAMLGKQLEPYGNTGSTYLTTQFIPTDPDYCEPESFTNCKLTVVTHDINDTDTNSSIVASFPLRARSKTPNEPPICRIASQPHGAPILVDITGIQQGERLGFYGEISTDEDSNHQMTDFEWYWGRKTRGITSDVHTAERRIP